MFSQAAWKSQHSHGLRASLHDMKYNSGWEFPQPISYFIFHIICGGQTGSRAWSSGRRGFILPSFLSCTTFTGKQWGWFVSLTVTCIFSLAAVPLHGNFFPAKVEQQERDGKLTSLLLPHWCHTVELTGTYWLPMSCRLGVLMCSTMMAPRSDVIASETSHGNALALDKLYGKNS